MLTCGKAMTEPAGELLSSWLARGRAVGEVCSSGDAMGWPVAVGEVLSCMGMSRERLCWSWSWRCDLSFA